MAGSTRMPLVTDTRGRKSWTLTFCFLAVLFSFMVGIRWLINGSIKDYGPIAELAGTFLQMTVGAFILRELGDKGILKGMFRRDKEEEKEE